MAVTSDYTAAKGASFTGFSSLIEAVKTRYTRNRMYRQTVNELSSLSARELADWVSLTPGTISPVLDRLEAKGWVRRTRSAEDRRRIDLEITDTGRTQWQNAPGVLPETGVAQFAALGDARRKALAHALDDLTALLAPRSPRATD